MEPTHIEAAALVPAPPEDVFEFLSDLSNHWKLTANSIRVVQLAPSADGGTVRIRGPLGISRTAHTHVTAARSPRLIIGIAKLGDGTRARVSWTLGRRGSKTRVLLAADVESATPFDRLLLAIGGRRFMQGVFERTLERLAERFA